MLRSITIHNYALIDELEIDLSPTLNIITGETGAGKSILLGAVGLLLGNKNDGAAIKDNSKSCIVEAEFDISALNLQPLFEANDWEWEPSVTIRRIISPSGKSRAFVGDIPATLAQVKELGSQLIDIHSQHQNLILSDERFRVESVDLVAQNAIFLDQYTTHFKRIESLSHKLKQLEEQTARLSRDEEWLRHQTEELDAAKLRTGEVEECEQELTILENADRISEVLNLLCARLEDDEHGALRGLKGSINELSGITKSYPAAAEYRDRLVSVLAELKDIDYSIAEMAQRVESDPEKLEKLSNRLGVIFSLCQKHRAQDLDELLAIQDDYRSKLNSVVNSDESLSRLRSEIREAEAKASKIAQQIEDKRKVAAAQISKQICQTLKKLGMAEAQLQIDIKRSKSLNAWGFNDVEFLFSSVKSKTPQPIDRVASGGELSRVMLSFKALLARHKQLPTIIFDEIDTGVSGGIADAMGEIIASLSASLQVVDITHLPQVASKGETHFVVYKEGGHTSIRLLNRSERINQIAMMISGSEISSAALEQAKNLLDA